MLLLLDWSIFIFGRNMAWYIYELSPTQAKLLSFLVNVFLNFSVPIVLLISIDRYFRVKYLNQYSLKMTKKRQKTSVIIVLMFASFQSLVGFFLEWKVSVSLGKVCIFLSYAGLLIFCFILYVFTYRMLKAHSTNTAQRLSPQILSTTKIASQYLFVTLFYIILLLIAAMSKFALTSFLSHITLTTIRMYGVVILSTHSLVYAMVFLKNDMNARRKLRRLLHFKDRNKVHFLSPQSVTISETL